MNGLRGQLMLMMWPRRLSVLSSMSAFATGSGQQPDLTTGQLKAGRGMAYCHPRLKGTVRIRRENSASSRNPVLEAKVRPRRGDSLGELPAAFEPAGEDSGIREFDPSASARGINVVDHLALQSSSACGSMTSRHAGVDEKNGIARRSAASDRPP